MRKLSLIFLSSLFILVQSCSKDDDIPAGQTLIYENNFDSDDGKFWLGSNENVDISIEKGNYYFLNRNPNRHFYITVAPFFTNSTTAASFEARYTLESSEGNDPGAGGILFNFDSNDKSLIRIQLNTEGHFRVDGYPDGEEHENYSDWQPHKAVKIGQANTVRVEMRDGKYYFYINGTEVFNMNPVGTLKLDKLGFSVGYKSIMTVDYVKAYTKN